MGFCQSHLHLELFPSSRGMMSSGCAVFGSVLFASSHSPGHLLVTSPRPLSSAAGVVDGGFHSGAFLCPSGPHLEVGLSTGSLLSTTFVSFLKAQVLGVGEVNGIGLTPAG